MKTSNRNKRITKEENSINNVCFSIVLEFIIEKYISKCSRIPNSFYRLKFLIGKEFINCCNTSNKNFLYLNYINEFLVFRFVLLGIAFRLIQFSAIEIIVSIQ